MKALLFDMDGLMIDSEPMHLESYNIILRPLGYEISRDEWKEYAGGTLEGHALNIVKRFRLDITPEHFFEQKKKIYLELCKNVKMQPGLIELLTKLDRYLKAVVSQGSEEKIHMMLSRLDVVHYFDELISAKEVGRPKPAPDGYLYAAEKLGVQPSECLVLEDSEPGVKSAKAAGMTCFAIPCYETKHQDFTLADLKLNSLDEVYENLGS